MRTLKWMTLYLFALWNIMAFSRAQECSEAKNATIEKVSETASLIIVDYGTRESCVLVQNVIFNGGQSSDDIKAAKAQAPPKPLYDLIPGVGYYKMHNRPTDWNSAKKICEGEGAHLAVVNTRAEGHLLMEMHIRLPNHMTDWRKDFAYIGVFNNGGKWTSIFGEPLKDLGSPWDGNQPQKKPNTNCGMIHTLDGLLHNGICATKLPFFCEREL